MAVDYGLDPDEPMTFAGLAERQEWQRRACEHLGLDPADVTNLRVEWGFDGDRVTVEWDGHRTISLDALRDLFAKVGTPWRPKPGGGR